MEIRKNFTPEVAAQWEKYGKYGDDYKKVEFDDETGGYIVMHKGHKLDDKNGAYELQTAKILSRNGYAIEMMDESKRMPQYDTRVNSTPTEIKVMNGYRNIHSRAEQAARQGAERVIYYINFDNDKEMFKRFHNVAKTIGVIRDIWYIKEGKLHVYTIK